MKNKLFFIAAFTITSFGVTSVNSQSLDQGLRNYWSFDDNFASVGESASCLLSRGNGNSAAPELTFVASGKFGKAMRGMVKTMPPVYEDLTPGTGSATCSFWFKPGATAGDASTGWSIIGKGASLRDSGGNTNNNAGWRLAANSSNQVMLYWFDGVNQLFADRRQLISTETIDPNEWNHIAWKRDVATSSISLFVNGVKAETTTNTGGNIVLNSSVWNHEFNSGLSYNGIQNNWFQGFLSEPTVPNSAMDDFGWWNRALTDAELEAFALGVKPISGYLPSKTLDQELTHYWNFNNNFTSTGTGTVVTLTGHGEGGNKLYSVDGKFDKAINGFFKQGGLSDVEVTPAGGNATCSFWFYPSQAATNANGWSIIGRGVALYSPSSGSNNNFHGWRVIAKPNNTVELIWFNGNTKNTATSPRVVLAGGTINVGEWNHIAFKREGSTMKLFVNGVPTSTSTNANGYIAFGPSDYWSKEFHTGSAYMSDANNWYRGFLGETLDSKLDEFGWWSRALTDDEIVEFSTGTKPISQYFPTKELRVSVPVGGEIALSRGDIAEELMKTQPSDEFYTVTPGTAALNFTATPIAPNQFTYWINNYSTGDVSNIISGGNTFSTYPMAISHITPLFTRYALPSVWGAQMNEAARGAYFTSVKIKDTEVISQSAQDNVFSLVKFGASPVTVFRTSSVTVTLQCANTTYNVFDVAKAKIYCDFNCDGEFNETDELVSATPWVKGSDVNPKVITFTVPVEASNGNSMIRIVMNDAPAAFLLESATPAQVVRYCYDLPIMIDTPTGLGASQSNIRVSIADRQVVVSGSNESFEVYNLVGGRLSSDAKLANGVYLVKVAGSTYKVVVK